MKGENFKALVVRALSNLPAEFRNKLENIDVVVQERPTLTQLAQLGLKRGETLLGLYEGVPHTKRSRGYNMALPDKITVFQRTIEAECRSEEELAEEVKRVVCHEIAHHFGIDDETLYQIESEKPRKRTK